MTTDPLIGQTVAHYKILRPLGAGGMGNVYEAEDSTLGRHVAVKFLSAAMQNNATTLERFQREARAASALNHPGICTVHAIEQFNGQHFIAMELIQGATLAQRIGKEPFQIGELLDIGIQVADALESAHSKGIAHRDLKPANIMINDRGQAKILDFGLAKVENASASARGGDQISELETMVDPGQLTVAGTVMGTVNYMSPEQARGQLTDSRTDLFSLGAVLYQMATGELPFQGDTEAVVFESILNRDPRPVEESNPAMPQALGGILEKALEKDRDIRYQTATDLKTDLIRLKRKLDSGERKAAELSDSRPSSERPGERSVAVLYFENLSGDKEDEYFRDGITEDVITELSKIEGLKTFSRSTVLAYRDKAITTAQIGKQIGAAYVLEGSLRRAGERLRINTQLVDTGTDHPIWSERYDREMKDVFAVQDEIARKIAEALRVKLSPQEQEALAAKPTENLQAYDLYLRAKSYARRQTRQDSEFALQMYENAVRQDPNFALAYAAIANVCAIYHYTYERSGDWMDRARTAAEKATALQPELPETKVAQAWVLYARDEHEDAVRVVSKVLEENPHTEAGYYLLLRCLFAAGRHQEIVKIAEEAIESSGSDYNVYVPIVNALGALGKDEAVKNMRQRATQALEAHLQKVPEDARARILLANLCAEVGRADDAAREIGLAMTLRPDDALVLYNAACVFCLLNRKTQALDALTKARRAGYKDSVWARNDPDLELLQGDPEFEKLFPES
jgi:serine/threonine protein kinase/tetratricopeptide (TPR) repeat protein